MLPPCTRRRCVSLAAILLDRVLQRQGTQQDTETMGKLVTRRFRPTRPPGRSGPLDRMAGGIGGAAPASLDLYGQSRIMLLLKPEWLKLSGRYCERAVSPYRGGIDC